MPQTSNTPTPHGDKPTANKNSVMHVATPSHQGQLRHNLPIALTTLIGRQSELGQIKHHLGDPACRLLTLTGTGGVGKSVLALEGAHQALRNPATVGRFVDGCFMIALAGVTQPALLPARLAVTLSIETDPALDLATQVVASLHSQRLLILLDNLEQRVADPDFLLRLMTETQDVLIMTTAREQLNLAGERLIEVEGLAVPASAEVTDAQAHAAVDLFAKTALAQQPAFLLSAELPTVVDLCQQLQGLPLGIQLAASAVGSYTCRQIADGVRNGLDTGTTTFDNLSLPDRSLRVLFEYLWGLLQPAEQQLLQQLTLFAGTFSELAASGVTGGASSMFAGLVSKSLVQSLSITSETPISVRYQLHPSIRQFASEHLAAHPSNEQLLRNRHAAYFCRLLAEEEQKLQGTQMAQIAQRLHPDWDNLCSAWQWVAAQTELTELERSTPALVSLYLWQGPLAEFAAMLETAIPPVRALANVQGSQRQRAAARIASLLLGALAQVENERGHHVKASEAAQEAVSFAQAARFSQGEAQGYLEWGRACFSQSRYEEAHKRLSMALATGLAVSAQPVVAAAHAALGLNRLYQGDYLLGKDHLEEALRLYEELGDQAAALKMRCNLALMYFYVGDFLCARTLFADCLAQYRALHDRRSVGRQLNSLGTLYTQLGDYAQARTHFDEAVALARRSGDRPHESRILTNLGLLAVHCGDYENGAIFCREALQISQELGEHTLTAYAQTCCGYALAGLGWPAEAADLFLAALTLRQELGKRDQMLEPLAGLAGVYLVLEQPARALGYVEQIMPQLKQVTAAGIVEPFRIYLTCYRVLAANHDPRAAAVLSAAHTALQERAAKLASEPLRRFFLEQVAVHRELMTAVAQSPADPYPDGAPQWRTRIEHHADLVHDLETLLHTEDKFTAPADDVLLNGHRESGKHKHR